MCTYQAVYLEEEAGIGDKIISPHHMLISVHPIHVMAQYEGSYIQMPCLHPTTRCNILHSSALIGSEHTITAFWLIQKDYIGFGWCNSTPKHCKIIFILFWLLKFSICSTASFEVTKFLCACRHIYTVRLKTCIFIHYQIHVFLGTQLSILKWSAFIYGYLYSRHSVFSEVLHNVQG
jgi:hypothetical protein